MLTTTPVIQNWLIPVARSAGLLGFRLHRADPTVKGSHAHRLLPGSIARWRRRSVALAAGG